MKTPLLLIGVAFTLIQLGALGIRVFRGGGGVSKGWERALDITVFGAGTLAGIWWTWRQYQGV